MVGLYRVAAGDGRVSIPSGARFGAATVGCYVQPLSILHGQTRLALRPRNRCTFVRFFFRTVAIVFVFVPTA